MSDLIASALQRIKESIPEHVTLVAVSKTKPLALLQEAYGAGQRHFGENRVQEVQEKAPALPADIKWHFIGHLQSKKVKHIIQHTHLIHSIDSNKLLEEVNKRAFQANKTQDVLLQMHIAQEETKYGLDQKELHELIEIALNELKNIRILGLMGMATFTEDKAQVRAEFQRLKLLFDEAKAAYFKDLSYFTQLSMGMSGDYDIAIEEGSTMVRIGSSIFGSRA
ncbi:MAG: YggS family pyridoxal phosphate-dependent enzyme [Flavobacteriales bacterium]